MVRWLPFARLCPAPIQKLMERVWAMSKISLLRAMFGIFRRDSSEDCLYGKLDLTRRVNLIGDTGAGRLFYVVGDSAGKDGILRRP